MSHATDYTLQPVSSCVSNRLTLYALQIGRYTVANLGDRVLLFARISQNFGIVITVHSQPKPVQKKDRLYTHFYSNILNIDKQEPATKYQCELTPKTSWRDEVISSGDAIKPTPASLARDKMISLLIVQEIGGLRCNETKLIELKVQTTRTTNPKNIIHTRD